jgi:predicted nuclease with RNAse H fold
LCRFKRPAGLVEEGFAELAKRWLPILNEFDQNGVDLCYEIHPVKIYLMEKRMKCFKSG